MRADVVVPPRAELAHVRGRVQEEGALEVPRRRDALVEDPHLRAVTNADDVAVDRDEIARAKLANLLFGGREPQAVLRHHASRS
jgi:predicted esterase